MPFEVMVGSPLVLIAKGSIAVAADGTVGIPSSALDRAKGNIEVFLSVETDQVRISPDGVTAAETDMLFDIGEKGRFAGAPICRNLRFIQVTGAATIRYWIFGQAI